MSSQNDPGEDFFWPGGQFDFEAGAYLSGSDLTNALPSPVPLGEDEPFPELTQDAPATEQAAPRPTQKTKKRKSRNEEDAETVQTGPSKRRKVKEASNKPNIYNVKQHVETDLKIKSIRDYIPPATAQKTMAGTKNPPRTIEACNRCKAKKTKCSTDPTQCKPCKSVGEKCYHAHPVTGHSYERGLDISGYHMKLRLLEQRWNEVESLRKRIEELEKRLEEDYRDKRIGFERQQRIEEEKEQDKVESAKQLEEAKYQELYEAAYREEELKQKREKEGKEAKGLKKPKAKAGGEIKEKKRSSTNKPIAKGPDQGPTQRQPLQPLQPSSYVQSPQSNYTNTFNQPGIHAGPSLFTTSGPSPFPGYSSNDDFTGPSLTAPLVPRQQRQPKQPRVGPRVQQPPPSHHSMRGPTIGQPGNLGAQPNVQAGFSQLAQVYNPYFLPEELQFQPLPPGQPREHGKRTHDQSTQNTQLPQGQVPDAKGSDNDASVEVGSPPFDDIGKTLSWE